MSSITNFSWFVRGGTGNEPFQFFLSTNIEDHKAGHDFLRENYIRPEYLVSPKLLSQLEDALSRDYVGVVQFAKWLTDAMHASNPSSPFKCVEYAEEILRELSSYLDMYKPESFIFPDLWAFMYINLLHQKNFPPSPAAVVSQPNATEQLIAIPVNNYGIGKIRYVLLSRTSINKWWSVRYDEPEKRKLFITRLESLADAVSYAQIYETAVKAFKEMLRNVEGGLRAVGDELNSDELAEFASNAIAMAASQTFGLSAPSEPKSVFAKNTKSDSSG